MPKLAERYTTKYGFQCLEKNVTRFEAEHALQISPEPLAVEDLNQYIVMANREHNLLYGLFHTVVLKRKSLKKRKEKITAATYLYQADSDGEWGEIQFDFENKTAQIIQLADWDKMISQPFAKYAISYLLNCRNEKLPKETVISFEM